MYFHNALQYKNMKQYDLYRAAIQVLRCGTFQHINALHWRSSGVEVCQLHCLQIEVQCSGRGGGGRYVGETPQPQPAHCRIISCTAFFLCFLVFLVCLYVFLLFLCLLPFFLFDCFPVFCFCSLFGEFFLICFCWSVLAPTFDIFPCSIKVVKCCCKFGRSSGLVC